MSNTIQRLCCGVLLALGITATATSASAQQAAPPQPTAQTTGRAGPPPIPEPEPATTPTVALDPIFVPRLRIRSVNRGDVQSTRRRAVDPAEDYRVRRIALAASLTALTAGAAEGAIFLGILGLVSNRGSAVGPTLVISGLVAWTLLVPATYTGVAYALEGTGGYGFALLGNILGIGVSIGLGSVLLTSAGSLAAFFVMSPLTLALCTAGIYELGSRPAPSRSTSRTTPIFPSIFATETTQGITFSGSF